MTEFDSPWKEMLDAYLPECLQLFFPEVHAAVDWSQGVQSLEQELRQLLPDSETGLASADKLVRVASLDGQDTILDLHVEVQNQPQARFPERMFRYFSRIWDHFGRPPVSLVILGDERPSFRPKVFSYERLGCRLQFEFVVTKVLDFTSRMTELEESSNPFSMVVLSHLATLATRNDAPARHREKVRLFRRMFEKGLASTDIRELYRFLDWLMNLPATMEHEFRREAMAIEEEHAMPYVTSIERLAKEEGREEGLKEGRKEGREEGREEGRKQAQEEGRHRLLAQLRAILNERFGPQAALVHGLFEHRSFDELVEILLRATKVGTFDEFRGEVGE